MNLFAAVSLVENQHDGIFEESKIPKKKHIDTFNTKLPAGLQGEAIARVFLESLGHKVTFPYLDPTVEQLRSGDYFVNGKPVEVKLDILAAKTGNICIEHRSLETHTAPYYIWILPRFYKVTKKQLEYIVASWPDVVKAGDDGRKATLLKIQSEMFRENFKLIE